MGQADRIMIIRHGEKPAQVNGKKHKGVQADGDNDDDSLTVRGWQRAGALCVLFGSAQLCAERGLSIPARLYASDPERPGVSSSRSRRPKQTLGPLSNLLGVETSLEFTKGQEAELAGAVMASPSAALIAWSHERIPAIARAILGAGIDEAREWPDGCYDLIWVFDRTAGGAYTFRRVRQALLPGDGPLTA